jgi:short-subunit dehydrogenase
MGAGYWHNKRVLVTGGSSGLGLVIAKALVQAGAFVSICGRRQSVLDEAARELRTLTEAPEKISSFSADVTRLDDAQRLIESVVGQASSLDILINAVGQSSRSRIADVTPDQFRASWETNFLSAANCTQLAMPALLKSKGHVVFIGSLVSKIGARYMGPYPAAKFPLAAYAQQLRLELGPQGLHTLLVCPGPIAGKLTTPERYEATNLPASAANPGGGANLKLLDPSDIALKILRACESRKLELILPGKAKLLFAISQMWPSLGDWLLLRNSGG